MGRGRAREMRPWSKRIGAGFRAARTSNCLILDLQMSGMSGIEVQQSLKMAGANCPIVIITAHDSPGLRKECMDAGATEYLSKPFDVRALMHAVSRVAPATH